MLTRLELLSRGDCDLVVAIRQVVALDSSCVVFAWFVASDTAASAAPAATVSAVGDLLALTTLVATLLASHHIEVLDQTLDVARLVVARVVALVSRALTPRLAFAR